MRNDTEDKKRILHTLKQVNRNRKYVPVAVIFAFAIQRFSKIALYFCAQI